MDTEGDAYCPIFEVAALLNFIFRPGQPACIEQLQLDAQLARPPHIQRLSVSD